MAMNKDTMAALCKQYIEAISNYPESGMSPVFVDDRILKARCQGIIEHIQAAALVNVTVASVSGVTTGGGVSGPGTGTGTIS